TGQDAEHSAFGARGNHAGRRRFGIKTAVARTGFGAEDAGLSVEAKDGGVNVGLSGENAGIVHEVARGEVVGTIGNDVELTHDVERVSAREFGVEEAQVNEGIDGPDLLAGALQLRAADIMG